MSLTKSKYMGRPRKVPQHYVDAVLFQQKREQRNKYKNSMTHGYHSKREYERACVLKLEQKAGAIRNLKEQVKYTLIPTQCAPTEIRMYKATDKRYMQPRKVNPVLERACAYVADFVYERLEGTEWKLVVEDVKGVRTQEYIIKRKLMLYVHKIRVLET